MKSKITSTRFCLRYLIPILVLSTFAADRANALFFFNNTSGLDAPAETVDFSEHTFADNTLINNQFSDQGVTFSVDLFYQNTFSPNMPNSDAPTLTNFNPDNGNGLTNPFSINFTSPVYAAAFVLGTNPNTTLFTALLNGIVVDSGSAPSSLGNAMDFYGFSGVVFDQIIISVGGDAFAVLDTLEFNPGTSVPDVPEPTTWALILVGAGLAGVMRLRRRTS
jgi:hypothetical protein